MTQMLELPDKKLKLVMINTLRNLAEKADTIKGQNERCKPRERERNILGMNFKKC